MRLTHRWLPTKAHPDHLKGWKHFLPHLAAAASVRDPWAAQPMYESPKR